MCTYNYSFVFFFQAEDGIRDFHVTGVQTCALPIWSPFTESTNYMDPGTASFMVNFRVADLDGLLAALRAEGCQVDEKTETSEQGKFGWVIDPEGNKVELWEPPARQ